MGRYIVEKAPKRAVQEFPVVRKEGRVGKEGREVRVGRERKEGRPLGRVE